MIGAGLGVLLPLLLTAAPARASVILSLSDAVAAPGDTGDYLDATLTNTGPAITVAAFSFGVSVAPGSGVNFTSVTTDTVVHPYIFAGNSLFAPDITNPGQTLPSNAIGASDVPADPFGFTSLATGESLALGHILFNVDSSASPGAVAVIVTAYPFTSLADKDANNINIDSLVGGTIHINAAITPIPGTSLLFVTALAGLTLVLRKRSDTEKVPPGERRRT
ncbi:MAG TPA: hypothetical protein VMT54_16030 [Candidatus Cybelea sp.]|nr:hypothetical protein [Candidatus Cybelea sp.]